MSDAGRELATIAERWRKKGDYVQARHYFKQALDADTCYQWAYAHLGETLMGIATTQQGNARQETITEAITRFSQAIRLYKTALETCDPKEKRESLTINYAWSLAHRGEAYRLTKRYDEALADFNRTLALRPDYPWALAHRGATYRFMADYERALTDFNRAIDLKPDYAWAVAWLARTYELMERYDLSLANFHRAAALDESIFSDLRSEQGMLLSYLGRYAEAIECCQQALLKNPDNHFALYNIAVCKTRWQGLASAKTEISKARAKLLPLLDTVERGLVLYRLGGLAALEGRTKAQALDYLEEAILLDDEALEFARHDLAWLELRQEPRFQALVTDRLGNPASIQTKIC